MIKRTLTLLGLSIAMAIAAHAAPAKPNILFIITDDQGYGDWSINGHPLLKTPNVDRLAAELNALIERHAQGRGGARMTGGGFGGCVIAVVEHGALETVRTALQSSLGERQIFTVGLN